MNTYDLLVLNFKNPINLNKSGFHISILAIGLKNNLKEKCSLWITMKLWLYLITVNVNGIQVNVVTILMVHFGALRDHADSK